MHEEVHINRTSYYATGMISRHILQHISRRECRLLRSEIGVAKLRLEKIEANKIVLYIEGSAGIALIDLTSMTGVACYVQ